LNLRRRKRQEKRKLHEELHNLYSLPNIRVIKPRRMRWVGCVAHIREMRNAYKIWSKTLNGRDHLEVLGIDRG
jgi:hypothetical protein